MPNIVLGSLELTFSREESSHSQIIYKSINHIKLLLINGSNAMGER